MFPRNAILIISSTRRGTNLLGSRISFNHPWTDWCPPAPEVCGLGAGEGVGWREGKGGSRRGLGWVGSSGGMGGGGLKQQKFGRQKQIGGSGTPSGLPRGLKSYYRSHVLLCPPHYEARRLYDREHGLVVVVLGYSQIGLLWVCKRRGDRGTAPLRRRNSETPQVAKVMGRKIGFERLFVQRR